jgi:peptidoglycan/xylan/chitin deacetylase (PgdA/CDA1 family)
MNRLFSLAAAAFALSSLPLSAEELPLKNPGFEDLLDGWVLLEKDMPTPMSSASPDAAREGSSGLRVEDNDNKLGSSLVSGRLPAKPGHTYRVTFHARSATKGKGGVYLRFHDAGKKIINGEKLPMVGIDKSGGEWQEYTLEAVAPEGTETLAVWVHTWSGATGTIDFDDFLVELVEDAAVVTPPPANAPAEAKPAAEDKAAAANAQREKPAMIVLKLDDLKAGNSGNPPPAWDRVLEILKKRNLKGSFGIIVNSLEADKPKYVEWLKNTQDTGLIEFWFHGWDHGVRDEGGVKLGEFSMRPYEEQKERFVKSIALMKEKTGITLSTFGPPGGGSKGGFDTATFQVMVEVPEMKTWLYPQPMDEPGQKLQDAGKVTVLDRAWPVNIEQPLFTPSSEKLISGYRRFPKRDYFVLQGHPTHWKEEGFAEFEKMLDFLTAEGATFVTPTECAAAVRNSSPSTSKLGAR